MEFIRTDSSNRDFLNLLKQLDAELAIRDGDQHGFYHQFNKVSALNNVIVAYQDLLPIACGAFKPFETHAVEVKRMFVHTAFRNKGVAAKLLAELERWATELQYVECVLETGLKQPEAIRLYEKCGYTRIPNYGQYAGIENSVCMKKKL